MAKRLFSILMVLLAFVQLHAQQSKPIQFREEMFDFGSINEDGGPAVHEFVFTNASGRPMKILSVQASCGCTTPDWSRDVVAPGKTGYIQASFNPKGRPGYFNKTLTVTTDLDANPLVLQIKGQVTSATEENKPAVTEFQSAIGNWKFKTASFNMGKVYTSDESLTKEFSFVNSGSKPVTFDKYTGPKYIKVDVQPKVVPAGQQAVVKIVYNGKLKNQYGFQNDNVIIQTDDEKEPAKSFSVYAMLEDYFPALSADELKKAPQLKIENSNADFGRVRQNTATLKELSFTNTGKKELNIKALQGNCTCISVSAAKKALKPGESGKISISFNPQDRKGTQTKAITVYSNDPQNPVQRITLSAYVED
jgi:hypothetical protein